MRAILIVNPRATSTPTVRRDVIAAALASSADLEVVQTRYRGHAAELAEEAAAKSYDIVFTLGGDGTINEAVNGMLRTTSITDRADRADGAAAPAVGDRDPPAQAAAAPQGAPREPDPRRGLPRPEDLPALAAIPCGLSNVFVRALGIPADPIDATGAILKALQTGHERRIGLGLAGDRYFTFSSGLGLDAEVIRAVEGERAGGRPASQALYVRSAVRHFYGVTDRRHPPLTLERDGQAPIGPLFIAIVSNTAPWTYLGKLPINPNPWAGFDTGIDVFGLRHLRTASTLNALRQMVDRRSRPPSGRHMVALHDEGAVTLRSSRPIAWHVDGDYLGETECVTFRSVPGALRVLA